MECYLCGEAFSEGNPATKSHVIARRWFGTPPPPYLPTLPAHFTCNNNLSPQEERIRNGLVRVLSHEPAAHSEVLQRAALSRQPPPREIEAGYYKMPSGLIVPTKLIVLPNPADVEAVFRGVTRGLFYKAVGRLMPQNVPIRSLLLQERDAKRISERMFKVTPGVLAFGNEFFFKPLMNAETQHDGFWLYLIFNAGIVASFTGDAIQRQFPPARLAYAYPSV